MDAIFPRGEAQSVDSGPRHIDATLPITAKIFAALLRALADYSAEIESSGIGRHERFRKQNQLRTLSSGVGGQRAHFVKCAIAIEHHRRGLDDGYDRALPVEFGFCTRRLGACFLLIHAIQRFQALDWQTLFRPRLPPRASGFGTMLRRRFYGNGPGVVVTKLKSQQPIAGGGRAACLGGAKRPIARASQRQVGKILAGPG